MQVKSTTGKTNLVGKVWENGEFGVGIVRKVPLECLKKEVLTAQEIAYRNELWAAIDQHGIEEVMKVYGASGEQDTAFNSEDSLGSSLLPISHRRARRGCTGISAYGRKLVRNAALRLEREVGKARLSFLTVTLPDVSVEESLRISANWAEIVRVFLQKLKRHLISAKLPGELVAVTEVQGKRLATTGVLGLHLHILFQGATLRNKWAFAPHVYRLHWKNTLLQYLDGDAINYKWDAVENVEPVRHAASSYIGKYMSKGVKEVTEIVSMYPDIVLPTAWYSCSNTLKNRTKLHIQVIHYAFIESFLRSCTEPDMLPCFAHRTPINISVADDRQICIGWCGRLSLQGVDWFSKTNNRYKKDYATVL